MKIYAYFNLVMTHLAHIFIWKTAGSIKASHIQQVAPMKAIRLPKSGIISTITPVLITNINLIIFYKKIICYVISHE